MATVAGPEAKFQIAHVLFIDIVGYSKLLVNDQAAAIRQLNEVVQATDEFRTAGKRNKLVRIPTGDGMALVFRDSPETPARCALAISRALQKQATPLRIRMGIHSGLVHGVPDVNNRLNVAGAGINIAQRVMDCGDAGHILLSKHVAEDLDPDAHWRPLLHDLGPCEVKHGLQVGLVNLYDSEAGNPDLPGAIRRLRERRRANSVVVFSSTAAISLLLAMGTWLVSTRYSKNGPTLQSSPNDPPLAAAGAEPTAAETPERSLNFAQSAATGYTWPPQLGPPPTPNSQKLFAGTWRGTIRNTGPKGTTTSPVEFTIDDSEKRWSNMRPGNSSRHGRTLSYTRSYRLGGTNVRQTAELTVNADGKTATYKSNQTSITRRVRSTSSGFGTLEKVD